MIGMSRVWWVALCLGAVACSEDGPTCPENYEARGDVCVYKGTPDQGDATIIPPDGGGATDVGADVPDVADVGLDVADVGLDVADLGADAADVSLGD